MKNNIIDTANPLTRRKFVQLSAIGLAAVQMPGALLLTPTPIKAVLFDGFVIFNPQPIYAIAEQLFPTKGNNFVTLWRSKQFEYCWLRTAGHQYKDFKTIAQNALNYSANKNGINITPAQSQQLIDAHFNMDIWPDVISGLKQLKEQGISISLLSNLTPGMLTSCTRRNQIEAYFDHTLSTDRVQQFKPAPAAYNMGIETLKLKKEQILFAAFAPWDVTGAKWFGYPTYWVNRANLPAEELDVKANGAGTTIIDMVNFLKA
jgi:2-haloacid dehalogenase